MARCRRVCPSRQVLRDGESDLEECKHAAVEPVTAGRDGFSFRQAFLWENCGWHKFRQCC
jgi:hypothetical protein